MVFCFLEGVLTQTRSCPNPNSRPQFLPHIFRPGDHCGPTHRTRYWGLLLPAKRKLIPGTSMPTGHFFVGDPQLKQTLWAIHFSHKHKQIHPCKMYTTPPLLKEKVPRLPWPAAANHRVSIWDPTQGATGSHPQGPALHTPLCSPQPVARNPPPPRLVQWVSPQW